MILSFLENLVEKKKLEKTTVIEETPT